MSRLKAALDPRSIAIIGASENPNKVGGRPVCIQLPIGSESSFKGIIDLLRMKAVVWEDEGLGAKYAGFQMAAGIGKEEDRVAGSGRSGPDA